MDPPPENDMTKEYKIKFAVPADYDPGRLSKQMPSPIHRRTMSEVYNFRIEKDGFYFVDSSVDPKVASVAFRQFVDEALMLAGTVEIKKL